MKRQAGHERDLSSAVVSQYTFARLRGPRPSPDLDEQRHGTLSRPSARRLDNFAQDPGLPTYAGNFSHCAKGCVQCPGRARSVEFHRPDTSNDVRCASSSVRVAASPRIAVRAADICSAAKMKRPPSAAALYSLGNHSALPVARDRRVRRLVQQVSSTRRKLCR